MNLFLISLLINYIMMFGTLMVSLKEFSDKADDKKKMKN